MSIFQYNIHEFYEYPLVYIKIRKNILMIIGKISKNDEKVKFSVPIHCTACNKQVPGRMVAEKKYSQTSAFKEDMENFKKGYLCGICRDKKRVNKK